MKQLNLRNSRQVMKADLDELRSNLRGKENNVSKICSTVDARPSFIRGKAGSGTWSYNPTIVDQRGIDPIDFCKTPEDYVEYYRSLLSDDYIEDLPDDFFAGKNKKLIKKDMAKLRGI